MILWLYFTGATTYLPQGLNHPQQLAQADVAYRDDGLHREDAGPSRSAFCGCCKEIGRVCSWRRKTQCVKLETCRPGKPTNDENDGVVPCFSKQHDDDAASRVILCFAGWLCCEKYHGRNKEMFRIRYLTLCTLVQRGCFP